MANNIKTFLTGLTSYLSGTNGLDAAAKKMLRDGFVEASQSEFDAMLTDGVTDTAALRMQFAARKVFDFMRANTRFAAAERQRKAMASAPLEDLVKEGDTV